MERTVSKIIGQKISWLVGLNGTYQENVTIKKVYGTADQVKIYLANLVRKDRREDSDYLCGDDETSAVRERSNGTLYAFSFFRNRQNSYTATPESLFTDEEDLDGITLFPKYERKVES